jgi:hypothetical protein
MSGSYRATRPSPKTDRLRWVKSSKLSTASTTSSPSRKGRTGRGVESQTRVPKPEVGTYYTLCCKEFDTDKHVTFRARCASSAVDEGGTEYEHVFDKYTKKLPDWLTAYAGSGTQGRLVFSQSMTSFGKGLYAGDDDVSVTW